MSDECAPCLSGQAVVVNFPLTDEPDTALLAWTTTPWTLPANLALCVHPEFDYVKVKDTASGKLYILAKCRLTMVYPDKSKKKKKKKQPQEEAKAPYEIVAEMKGKDLRGKTYEPIFPYFKDLAAKGCFRVITDT